MISTICPDLVSTEKKPGFTTEVARNFYLHDSFKDSIMQEIKDSRLGTRGKYVYSCVNFIHAENDGGKPDEATDGPAVA